MPFARRAAAALLTVAAVACSPAQPLDGQGANVPGRGGPVVAVDRGLDEPMDPTLGNPGYDVKHYDLDLAWDPASQTLDATVTLTATAKAALDTFNLDFIGFDVKSVRVDGAAAAFARTEHDITVRPAMALSANNDFSASINYTGVPHPIESTGGAPVPIGWTTNSGTSYVVSEPDGARAWFPCNDHPSDKATYTFHISVPDSVVAAANGVLRERIAGSGRTTWVWDMTDPMATYLATVVIGDYAIVNDAASSSTAGIPVRNLLPAASSRGDTFALSRQGAMIAYLSGLFGPYPFKAYGVAVVPGFLDALETQTLTVSGVPIETIVLHELSHQWFGDDVSVARWQDVWLSEGFATYAEWLWQDHTGTTPIADLARQAYDAAGALAAPGDPSPHDLFNSSVYVRGALTLYALRQQIGGDKLNATLRAWVSSYGGGSATTADFIALAEETSGTHLQALFDGWLHSAELPPWPGP